MTKEKLKSMNDKDLIRSYGFAKFHKSTTMGLPEMGKSLSSHVAMYEEEMNRRNIPLDAKEQDYE